MTEEDRTRIALLVVSPFDLVTLDRELLDALLEAYDTLHKNVKAVQKYVSYQADHAQLRRLREGRERVVAGVTIKETLYDDNFWQPVADKVRFELAVALAGDEVDLT